MKKMLLALVLFSSLTLSLGLCACEHKHSTGKWVDEVPATCMSDGVKGHYTCETCGKDLDRNGKEIEDLILKKTDHEFSYKSLGDQKHVKECIYGCGLKGEEEACSFVTVSVLKQATCTEAGEEVKACAFCHEEMKVAVNAAHVFDLEKTATPATCSKAGNSEYRHCSVCDQNIAPDGTVLKDNEWVIPATGEHSFVEGVVTKSPTCKEKGEKTLTCIHCGEEKTEELPLTDHFPIKVPETLPTCFEEGLSSGEVCAVCQTVIKEQEVLPKLEHKFTEWETVIEPDENFGGLKVRTCTLCETSENVEATPSEHKWGEWEYDEETDRNTRKCTECEAVEDIECLYSAEKVIAPTCTEKGHAESVCQLCGHVLVTEETEPLGHEFDAWKADKIIDEEEAHVHSHSRTCKHCGYIEQQNCNLAKAEVISPTCELGGYTINRCTECGSEHEDALTEALGHNYGEYQQGEGGRTHIRICATCQREEVTGCYFSSEVIPATCTQQGMTRYTCKTCQNTYDENVTPALGHLWGDWTFDESSASAQTRTHSRTCTRCDEKETANCEMVDKGDVPTCTAKGSLEKYCKDCKTGVAKDKENESLGHEWSEWQVDEKDSTKHFRTCTRCNEREEMAHSYKEEVSTQADCINPAKVTMVCDVCKNKLETTNGTALGHEWGDWTITKDTHERTCKKCNTKETTEHVYADTNLCTACEYDCLTYALVGSHFVLKSDENLPDSVTKVIVAGTHTQDEKTHAVTEIERYAFYRKQTIKEVVLPESVHTIDDFAFDYCSALESVIFEKPLLLEESEAELKGLHTINMCAFEGCTSLKDISLPDTVETIGYGCFSGCVNLKEISLTNVTSVGSGAFDNTGLIKDTTKWQKNVFILGNHLIDTDKSEEKSYTIPQNIVSIGRNAFTDWANLEELTIPTSVIYFDRNAFEGCDRLTKVTYKGNFTDWMKITFVNDAASPLLNVTEFSLEGAKGELKIESGVKSIPAGTFRGTEITKVVIPDTVTYIGEEAFENCAQLTEIEIPDTVTFIGKDAFKDCAYYKDTTKWTNGVLYIGKHLIKADEKCAGEYTITEGTISIGIEAFTNSKATVVTIPGSVTRIGARAFCDNKTLTGVKFADTTNTYFANKLGLISRVYKTYTDEKANLHNLQYMDGEWKYYGKATK